MITNLMTNETIKFWMSWQIDNKLGLEQPCASFIQPAAVLLAAVQGRNETGIGPASRTPPLYLQQTGLSCICSSAGEGWSNLNQSCVSVSVAGPKIWSSVQDSDPCGHVTEKFTLSSLSWLQLVSKYCWRYSCTDLYSWMTNMVSA